MGAMNDLALPSPPRQRPISPRQQATLRAVVAHILAHGYPPTWRELTSALGVASVNATGGLVITLINKGYLRRAHEGSRSIMPTHRGWTHCEVPACPACHKRTRVLYACMLCPAEGRQMRCLGCVPRCSHVDRDDAGVTSTA